MGTLITEGIDSTKKSVCLIILVLCGAVLLTSCSMNPFSNDDEDADLPKPIVYRDMSDSGPPSLKKAQQLYKAGLYEQARKAFQNIASSNPYGPFAFYAEIKAADSAFYGRDFKTASLLYEDLYSRYPSSPDTPYLLLQIARSYQKQYRGLGRDVQPLESALKWYENFINTYPESIYLNQAISGLKKVQSDLLAHEKLVANFYLEHGKKKAYDNRMKYHNLLAQQFNSSNNGEGTAKLASLSRNTTLSPKTGRDYYLRNVPRRLNIDPLPEILRRDLQALGRESEYIDLTTTLSTENINHLMDDTNTRKITRIMCKHDKGIAFLHLSKPLSLQETKTLQQGLSTQQAYVSFSIPNTHASPRALSCFSSKDLKIGQNGDIVLKTNSKEVDLVSLSYPPRIMMVLR